MWEVAASINSLVSLLAFVIAVAATSALGIIRIRSSRDIRAIEHGNSEVVGQVLERFTIDTRNLTPDHQFTLAVEQLRERRRRLTTILAAVGAGSVLIAMILLFDMITRWSPAASAQSEAPSAIPSSGAAKSFCLTVKRQLDSGGDPAILSAVLREHQCARWGIDANSPVPNAVTAPEPAPAPPGCVVTIQKTLVSLLKEPQQFSRELSRVQPGKYTVIRVLDGWFEIQASGRTGWIPDDTWTIERKAIACP